MPRRKAAFKKNLPSSTAPSTTQIREIINLHFQKFVNDKMKQVDDSTTLDATSFFIHSKDTLAHVQIEPETSEKACDQIKNLRIFLARNPVHFKLSLNNLFKLFNAYARTFKLAEKGTMAELYMVFRYLQSHADIEANINYDKHRATYTNMCKTVTQVINKDRRPYSFRSDKTHEDVSAEVQIIKALAAFQLPMDFIYTSDTGETVHVVDMMQSLMSRAQAFFSDKDRDIHPKNFTTILTGLEHIDYELDDNLHAPARSLITTTLVRGFHDFQQGSEQWSAEDLARFIRSNAILCLKQNGRLEPILSWNEVHDILIVINDRLCNQPTSDKLSDISAKVLLQVYAAYYPEHRNQKAKSFPPELKKHIDSFIDVFSKEAKSSVFEERLQSKSFPKAINQLNESYPYIKWDRCLNFDNPYTDFGLETDILFTHPETGIQVPIQVDGFIYHTYNAVNEENRNVNKRTRFRDYNFRNFGLLPLIISDKGKGALFHQQIFELFRDNIVYQVHNKLHRLRHEAMKTNLNKCEELAAKQHNITAKLKHYVSQKKQEIEKIDFLLSNVNTYSHKTASEPAQLNLSNFERSLNELKHQVNQDLSRLEREYHRFNTQSRKLSDNLHQVQDQIKKYGQCYQEDFAGHIKEATDTIARNRAILDNIEHHISALYGPDNDDRIFTNKRKLEKELNRFNAQLSKFDQLVQFISTKKSLPPSFRIEDHIQEICLLSQCLPESNRPKFLTKDLNDIKCNNKIKRKISAFIHNELSGLEIEKVAQLRHPILKQITVINEEIEQIKSREQEIAALKQQKNELVADNIKQMKSRKQIRDRVREADIGLKITIQHRQLYNQINQSIVDPKYPIMPDYTEVISEFASELDQLIVKIDNNIRTPVKPPETSLNPYSPSFFPRSVMDEAKTHQHQQQTTHPYTQQSSDYPAYNDSSDTLTSYDWHETGYPAPEEYNPYDLRDYALPFYLSNAPYRFDNPQNDTFEPGSEYEYPGTSQNQTLTLEDLAYYQALFKQEYETPDDQWMIAETTPTDEYATYSLTP